MRVVVVLPTYNEAENVRPMLAALLAIDSQPDILVVDDSSPDGTADLARQLASTEPRVTVHQRAGKQGLGAAYVDGFTRALAANRYDAIVQMDADGSHEPTDVDRLVAALDSADLAIGSRYVDAGAVEGWPAHRKWLSRGGNAYARMWLRLPVVDLTGGFKAWRAETLRGIGLGEIRSDGYGFQVETTARALARGARVVEVPITFRNRTRGTSKMNSRIALEALRVVPTLRTTSRT